MRFGDGMVAMASLGSLLRSGREALLIDGKHAVS